MRALIISGLLSMLLIRFSLAADRIATEFDLKFINDPAHFTLKDEFNRLNLGVSVGSVCKLYLQVDHIHLVTNSYDNLYRVDQHNYRLPYHNIQICDPARREDGVLVHIWISDKQYIATPYPYAAGQSEDQKPNEKPYLFFNDPIVPYKFPTKTVVESKRNNFVFSTDHTPFRHIDGNQYNPTNNGGFNTIPDNTDSYAIQSFTVAVDTNFSDANAIFHKDRIEDLRTACLKDVQSWSNCLCVTDE